VNLYPSIPIQASISVITTLLEQDESFSSRTKLTIEEVRMLIKVTLSRCYFLWEDEIHVLQDSGPIGLSLMVVMAEGFLQFHEKNAIRQALSHVPPINLKSFVRYVDDSHARFPTTVEADQFLGYLNAQDENIQYTVEQETEDGLNFLDVNIKNNGLGKYEFAIHRKQAITNVQIKPHSSHDPKVLKGVFKGFVHRAFTLCSDKHIDEELSFLVNSFKENGYSESILTGVVDSYRSNQNTVRVERNITDETKIVKLPWIPGVSVKLKKTFRKAGFKAVFKSGNNLSAILTARNKCKLPKNSSPGIYKVNCSCGKYYIGETKLKVSTRLKQHQKNSFLGNTAHSGLCQHDSVCEGDIQWEEAETIKVEGRYYERKIREALEIQRQNAVQAGCNQDAGQYMSNEHWLPIYQQIN
jgi:predicted GIY-YIG superfamily endonuclease